MLSWYFLFKLLQEVVFTPHEKNIDQKSDEKQACDFNRAAAKEGLRLKTLPSLSLSSISKKLKICWKITVT